MKMKKWLKRIGWLVLILFIFLNVVSAFHAYRFTHFYGTKEVVVKAPEHMNGWEKTNAILFGVDFNKKQITTTPLSPFQNFTVTTTDSLHLSGWYIPKDSSLGTVIVFHGHGGCRSGVVKEAEEFHTLGYNVAMIDFRAHGESEGNICTIGFLEANDVKATYDYVVAKGEKNIILWGISLGAATITKAMDEYKEIQPSKVILEMPFGSLMEAVEGRMHIMKLPAQPLAGMLTFWGGTQQGFWAFNHKPSEYVTSISTPVLLQWGLNDPRVSKSETDEIYKNLASKNKKLVVYDESGHQSLFTNEQTKWVTNVTGFLQDTK